MEDHNVLEKLAAEITLNTEGFAKGYPRGEKGQKLGGFSFFKIGKDESLEYITSRIGTSPVLEAVTQNQYETWEKWEIVAYAAEFRWNDNVWEITDGVETKV